MLLMLKMQFEGLGKAASGAGKSIKKAFKNNWLMVALYLIANTIGSVIRQAKKVKEVTNETLELVGNRNR